jgi:hypothetical protein
VFWGGAVLVGIPALAIFIRFVIYFLADPNSARGHIQSLIAGAVLFLTAVLLGALGVIGDLLDAQRTLSQRTFERVRRIELQLGVQPSHYQPGASAAQRARVSAVAEGDVSDPSDGQGPGDTSDREALGV